MPGLQHSSTGNTHFGVSELKVSFTAVRWQLVGQLLGFTEHIPLVCPRLLSGKKRFKVKASKEDKGESLLSHERR